MCELNQPDGVSTVPKANRLGGVIHSVVLAILMTLCLTPIPAIAQSTATGINTESPMAKTPGEERFYIGIMGGTGALADTTLRQQGGVYLTPSRILPVDAQGSTGHTGTWFAGIQAGYEIGTQRWSGGSWEAKPALEAEALWLGHHTPVGNMPIRPRFLGTQYVKLPMDAQLLMANAVVSLKTPYSQSVQPYAGIGIGAAFLSISGADSANPTEPGINHFNSGTNASATALAAQFKLGLRAQLQSNLSWFVEYRLISINPTNYTFGATDYPGLHLPTKPWQVSMGRLNYNLFVMGLQYRF